MPDKKPMSANAAAFLIKMAESSALRREFAQNTDAVAAREHLSDADIIVVTALKKGHLAVSVSADGSDPTGQNQQMFIFEKKTQ